MDQKEKVPAQSTLWSPPSPLATSAYWSSMAEIARAKGESVSVFSATGPLCSDIRQQYASSFLTALLSIVYRYPEFVESLFVKRELWASGIFTITFCTSAGKMKEIDVDNMLPADPGSKEAFFAKPRSGAFWVPIIEKAFAKLRGSWSDYEAASTKDAYKAICRAPGEVFTHASYDDATIWEMLTRYLMSGYPMIAKTGDSAHHLGLANKQSYVVLSTQTELPGCGQCICLCSPCESNEYRGDLCGHDTCSIEGSFYVSLAEYMSAFQSTSVCLLKKSDIWVQDGENADLDPYWLKMWSSDTIKDLKLVLEHDHKTHWNRNMVSTPARLQRLWLGGGPNTTGGAELPSYRLIGDCMVDHEQPFIMTRWRPDQMEWAERVSRDIKCFDSAPDVIKHDPMICIQLVCRNGLMLEKLSRPLRADRYIVLGAVRQNGLALVYAQASLKDDRDIVLHAVRQNGFALQYASAALKDDGPLVLEAVRQNPVSFRFASSAVRGNPEIIQYVCQLRGGALECTTEEFRLNADLRTRKLVSLMAVAQDGLSLAHTAPDLRLDGDVVLVAVCQNPDAIKWADAWFRSHRFMINVVMGKSKAPTGSWKHLKAWAEKNGGWEGCWEALKDWHAANLEE